MNEIWISIIAAKLLKWGKLPNDYEIYKKKYPIKFISLFVPLHK